MEVCIDSVESAVNAERGGAKRVELCANLMEGGTTPSTGMLIVIKQLVRIPVFAMIRPRGGDFLYTDHEFEVMKSDVKLLKDAGADGIVFGILLSNGCVDISRCTELIEAAKPLSVTFHRAIDMTVNISLAMEQVIRIGFQRVLTSGGSSSALEGLPIISQMVKQANGRIIVVPGGGINQNNLQRILDESKAIEFHASARSSSNSDMQFRNAGISMGAALSPPEFTVKITDTDKVRSLVGLQKECLIDKFAGGD